MSRTFCRILLIAVLCAASHTHRVQAQELPGTDTLHTDSLAAVSTGTDSTGLDSLPAALPRRLDSIGLQVPSPAESLAVDTVSGLATPPPAQTAAADSASAAGVAAPDSLLVQSGTGATGGDRMGSCLAVVPDLDADGLPDVAVGVPGKDGEGVNAGAVLLLSGRSGDTLKTLAGERAGDAFGAALAGMGDVNRDGTPDLAVSAPYWDQDSATADAGKVYVYSGVSGELLWSVRGDHARAQLGTSLAGLEDTDGDGTADLAIGCASSPGDSVSKPGTGVWVVSGAGGAVLHRLAGEQPADRFGSSLASGSDMNGDGLCELLVGACRYSEGSRLSSGVVYVISGRTGETLYRLSGKTMFEQFGYAVAGGQDVNGDRTPDIAVGARFLDHEGGRRGGVSLFSGRDGALLISLPGVRAGQHFGSALAFTADVDSDGRADLLVGAPGSAHGEVSEGVYHISTGSGATLLGATGTAAGSRFGNAVADFADVDRDGRADILAGAPYHSQGGSFAGAVLAVSSRTGGVIWTVLGRSSLRSVDSARVAPLMSLDQLKEAVAAYDFPIYDTTEVDAAPIIRRSSAATYPPSAVASGATGWVKVKVLVLPDGSVAESEVTDDAGLGAEFAEAALAAVRDWSFLPASRAGLEVACWAVFPIGFAPPLSPEEQRRVDSLAATDSVSRLVVDSASGPIQVAPTDTAAQASTFYEVDQVDIPPVLAARVEPDYPPPALLTGDACVVRLRVLVNGQGAVADVQIGDVSVKGKGFEAAAVAAVRRWRYEPGVKEGNKVAVWVSEELSFNPPSDSQGNR